MRLPGQILLLLCVILLLGMGVTIFLRLKQIFIVEFRLGSLL